MATPPDDGLRTRLREGRRGVGLRQQDVADAIGVTRRAVSEWESGLRRPHQKLPELAALYGVSVSYLLTGAEESSVELRALRELMELMHEDIRFLRDREQDK
jgi:transcriptional regulator with XRE-family HTH domain